MLISPQQAIKEGWIKGDITPEMIQPNGIDWTLDQINLIIGSNCEILKDRKRMRSQVEVARFSIGDTVAWALEANRQYDITSNLYVEIPEGKAAIMILRSTFVRNGMSLFHGLYDSGFKGHIGGILHTNGAAPIVEVGTRVAQILFVDSDSVGLYAGGYNTDVGTHWSEKHV